MWWCKCDDGCGDGCDDACGDVWDEACDDGCDDACDDVRDDGCGDVCDETCDDVHDDVTMYVLLLLVFLGVAFACIRHGLSRIEHDTISILTGQAKSFQKNAFQENLIELLKENMGDIEVEIYERNKGILLLTKNWTHIAACLNACFQGSYYFVFEGDIFQETDETL